MNLHRRVKQASRSLESRRQTLGRQWRNMPWRPRGETLVLGALVLAFVAGFVGRRLQPAVVAGLRVMSRLRSLLNLV